MTVATDLPRGIWTLAGLAEEFPDGQLLVRLDAKGKPIETMYAVPRAASEISDLLDSASIVAVWSSRVRGLATTGRKGQPIRCFVAFVGTADPDALESWRPLTLALRERIGLV